MALKNYNPVTASLRGTVLIDRSELYKGKPVKTLTEGKNKTGGRNNHGRTTSFFRGGGHKQTSSRAMRCRWVRSPWGRSSTTSR
jgi:large subunit ribosomal protein L2